ncbi:MAG: hypothetical protein IJU50_00335, partial [Lachnospiraceae bacterium]|nr:hypothetical protein [Lachnospiraceae bacterium]
MKGSAKNIFGNLFLLGSLVLFFALVCRWLLIFPEDILDYDTWTELTLVGEYYSAEFNGDPAADVYGLILHFVFIIFGNRRIGAILLHLFLIFAGSVLMYFGLRNLFGKVAAPIGTFLVLLVGNVSPEYFAFGPDELVFFLSSLALFAVSLGFLVDSIIITIFSGIFLGIGIVFFPPVFILLAGLLLAQFRSKKLPVFVKIPVALVSTAFGVGLVAIPNYLLSGYYQPEIRTRTLWFMIPVLAYLAVAAVISCILFFVRKGKGGAEKVKDGVDKAIEGIEAAEALEKEKQESAAGEGQQKKEQTTGTDGQKETEILTESGETVSLAMAGAPEEKDDFDLKEVVPGKDDYDLPDVPEEDSAEKIGSDLKEGFAEKIDFDLKESAVEKIDSDSKESAAEKIDSDPEERTFTLEDLPATGKNDDLFSQ